jgi:hypothetical protein
VDEMKYFIFYREDNNFNDILKDKNIKKYFDYKVSWYQYLLLGSETITDETQSYLVLKYGDDMKDKSYVFPDRKPVPFVDYTPDRKRPKKFTKL